MKQKYLLGVDIGTTSLKAAVFDENGKTVRSTTKEYTLIVSGDRVEFPAERYWELFLDAFCEVTDGISISALAVDTQCETLIVADEDGKPLTNAIVWLDNRAAAEADIIRAHFGNRRVYETTGQPEITATWPACKLLWLRENMPRVFSETKKIFLLEDYLLYKLTGKFVTEKTLQSSSLYFDIRSGDWWDEMLNFIGVRREMLPHLRESGEAVGEFRGALVATSAIDQIAGAIGAGVVEHGIISEMTGTTMVIFVPADDIPPYNPDSIVPCHVNFDGRYCMLAWTPSAGIALKWFKNNLCEGKSFRELDALAESVAPGSAGLTFLPYLSGSTMPKYNPDARGAFLGLTMEHTRAHMVRAILESVACMLKSNLDYLDVSVDEIRSMGGGASSPLWCGIKADMTGKKITTMTGEETACLGSAILAGVASGVFESVRAACAKIVKTDKTYIPSGENYRAVYNRFCEMEAKIL